jgi:phage protein D
MAKVVNLRTVRKQAARAAARAEAEANAAKHGRTKAERALQKAEAEKAARDLDAHRRDPG